MLPARTGSIVNVASIHSLAAFSALPTSTTLPRPVSSWRRRASPSTTALLASVRTCPARDDRDSDDHRAALAGGRRGRPLRREGSWRRSVASPSRRDRGGRLLPHLGRASYLNAAELVADGASSRDALPIHRSSSTARRRFEPTRERYAWVKLTPWPGLAVARARPSTEPQNAIDDRRVGILRVRTGALGQLAFGSASAACTELAHATGPAQSWNATGRPRAAATAATRRASATAAPLDVEVDEVDLRRSR